MKKIRKILSSVAFFILLYGIYRFYLYTVGRMPQPEEVPIIVAAGIILIVLIGVIGALRYFYDAEDKSDTTKHRELGAGLSAYGIIASEKKTPDQNSIEQKIHRVK